MRALDLFACAALAGLAACSDGSPTTAAPAPPPQRVEVAFDCSVTVATRAMRCSEARTQGSGRGNLFPGSPYIQLSSRNIHSDSGQSYYTFELAVRNLIPQKLGTTDGTTVAPGGIRIFIESGPTVTSGAGTMTVNPDGVDAFTNVNQPFYEYDEVLADGVQSSFKTWTFTLTPTVLSFSFALRVSAPVQYPNGWVVISPDSSYVPADDESNLTATAYNALGVVMSGPTFTWSSSNTSVATISSGGVLVAMNVGSATITATYGPRSGTAKVVVF